MILTVKDALNNGYKLADTALARGYISRKNFNLNTACVYEAGGTRKGQLFAFVPNWRSTAYCIRQYLTKD